MEREKIKKLLEDVRDGRIEIEDGLRILKGFPYQDLGFAKIDTHRDLRKGFPEVILCKGKTLKQIEKIVEKLLEEKDFVMATKAEREVFIRDGYNELRKFYFEKNIKFNHLLLPS